MINRSSLAPLAYSIKREADGSIVISVIAVLPFHLFIILLRNSPYSLAAFTSWMEQGPTTTSRRSSRPLITFSAAFRPSRMVCAAFKVRGMSSIKICGGIKGLMHLIRLSSSSLSAERDPIFCICREEQKKLWVWHFHTFYSSEIEEWLRVQGSLSFTVTLLAHAAATACQPSKYSMRHLFNFNLVCISHNHISQCPSANTRSVNYIVQRK